MGCEWVTWSSTEEGPTGDQCQGAATVSVVRLPRGGPRSYGLMVCDEHAERAARVAADRGVDVLVTVVPS